MRHGNKTTKAIPAISYAACHVLALVSILSACAPQSTIPTPMPTVTLIQRDTVRTSTPFLTATPRPTATASPTSTPDVVATLASEFEISSLCLFSYLLSNDGAWIGADCRLSRELIIVNKTSKEKFIVRYEDIIDERVDGLTLRPLSWSSDNRFLYFTTRCCHYDDNFNKNGSLYQHDAQNGKVSKVLHGSEEPSYFFSKGGERYTYINKYWEVAFGFTLEIGMVEIYTRKNKRIVLQGYTINENVFQWSANENKFAVIIERMVSHTEHTADWKSVLLMIDFTRMDMEIIEEFDRNNLFHAN